MFLVMELCALGGLEEHLLSKGCLPEKVSILSALQVYLNFGQVTWELVALMRVFFFFAGHIVYCAATC